MIEILAPAGSIDSLKAAVYSGADAVYLGLNAFNARMKAENFTKDNLSNWVDFAHLYGVKVYLAINTLIKNSEMEEALEAVRVGIDAKVDAFIMADLGLIYLCSKRFKGIIIHASTQMGICNLSGAKIVEKLGVKRVVLARETKLEDIKLIKENTNLEIEYFVQGALCVCFSGNCYYSSMLYNKSGNRGECLQPCRLKFKLNNGEYKTLLSTKDLCLIDDLQTLIGAGVMSFKIEGRNRRPAYVAQAVRCYKKALKGEDTKPLIEDLKKVFVRGDFNYYAYLYKDKDKEIINPNTSGHTGVKIGKVVEVKSFKDIFKIYIETKTQINSGDGLKFIYNNDVVSIGVGNVKRQNGRFIVYSKNAPKVNSTVFRTLDYIKEKELVDYQKKIYLSVELIAKENRAIEISLRTNNIFLEYQDSYICEKAKSIPTANLQLEEAFSKTKDTPFVVKVSSQLEEIFIPASQLNRIRRDAIERATKEILDKYNKNLPSIKEIDYSERCPEMQIKRNLIKEEIIVLPSIATERQVKSIKINEDKFIVANNLWGLRFKNVIAGPYLNVYNDYTILALKSLGAIDVCYSFELNESEVSEKAFVYEGKPILMQLAHCPFMTEYNNDCKTCKFIEGSKITSEDNRSFELRRQKINGCCYFEILSDKKLTPNGKYKIIY